MAGQIILSFRFRLICCVALSLWPIGSCTFRIPASVVRLSDVESSRRIVYQSCYTMFTSACKRSYATWARSRKCRWPSMIIRKAGILGRSQCPVPLSWVVLDTSGPPEPVLLARSPVDQLLAPSACLLPRSYVPAISYTNCMKGIAGPIKTASAATALYIIVTLLLGRTLRCGKFIQSCVVYVFVWLCTVASCQFS